MQVHAWVLERRLVAVIGRLGAVGPLDDAGARWGAASQLRPDVLRTTESPISNAMTARFDNSADVLGVTVPFTD